MRIDLSHLRVRLVLLVTAAVLPALTLLGWQAVERRRHDVAGLYDTTLNLARLAAQAQERRVEGARQLLIALSHASELQGGSPDACTQYVRALVTEYGGLYTEIGWADVGGRVMCHARPGPGLLSIADRPYFDRVKSTNAFAVGVFIRGRLSGAPVLPFAYPMRDAQETLTGVVFANIDLRLLSRSLAADAQQDNAVISVLDTRGGVLARSIDGEQWIGRGATPEQMRAVAARGELVAESTGPDGVYRVSAVAPVRNAARETVLFVSVEVPYGPLVATVNSRLTMDLLAFAVLGLGILAAALAAAEAWIRRPIARLQDATRMLAEGKLETRTQFVSGVQELENLERAFNQMAEQLERRDVHLREGQRLEAVGQLAGGIAHDFNNLLTVIIGYAESLSISIPPGSPHGAELAELRAAADRAARLTQQLLAFSRRQMLQPKPVDLNEIIRHMELMMTRTLGGHIQLLIRSGPGLGIVRADPAQIEQVLMNLAINARDAMPAGGTITIETSNLDVPSALEADAAAPAASVEPGSYVLLSVADTGIGMAAETRVRIFEPFFSTKGTHGTGLGLATVYGIVKQSGGAVFCDSEVGGGARFSIYLPKTTDVADVGRPAADGVPASGNGEIILCVEDQPSVLNLVRRVLERHGYHPLTEADPRAALAVIQSDARIDLLISDVQLPGINGPTLYKSAVGIRPGLRVIFMSGFVDDSSAMVADGRSAFLQKPFTPAALLLAVRALLDAGTSGH